VALVVIVRMKKNLSKYTRHKILKLFNAGASVERIAAETGIRIDKIKIVLYGANKLKYNE